MSPIQIKFRNLRLNTELNMKQTVFSIAAVVMAICLAACDKEDWNLEPADSDLMTLNNGHPYVDLGLSVKWASCNIGATDPWEAGDCFAWGETKSKETFTTDTYTHPEMEALTMLNDAACTNWGGTWRMPTADEIKELLDNCTWKYAKYPGSDVYGYKVTSKVEGFTRKYIFLPVTGYKDGAKLCSADGGFYWSANSNKAYPKSLYFNSRKNECQDTYPYYGYAVRPVCK